MTWSASTRRPRPSHLIIESMRRAHRDRAEYLGDPDFVKVPVDTADRPGLRRRPARLDPRGQGNAERDRCRATSAVEVGGGTQTTHFSIIDADGNRVAGLDHAQRLVRHGLVVPGTGILLNNQMDDFAIKPGVPKHVRAGGRGRERRSSRGKRPLSSMAPTFSRASAAWRSSAPRAAASFRPWCCSATLNWMQGADARAIVAAPRYHQQY